MRLWYSCVLLLRSQTVLRNMFCCISVLIFFNPTCFILVQIYFLCILLYLPRSVFFCFLNVFVSLELLLLECFFCNIEGLLLYCRIHIDFKILFNKYVLGFIRSYSKFTLIMLITKCDQPLVPWVSKSQASKCTSMQSDQALYCWLLDQNQVFILILPNFGNGELQI